MAARQTKKKAISKREASDEGVGSSQRSLDEDLNLKIFAEMRARRTKRQKKVQSEFREETEKAIEELRVDTVSKFRKHLDDITNMHNIFRQEQVTIQAEIRELWVEVAKTHSKFMVRLLRHYKAFWSKSR
ncbi:hypothetical protein FRC18_011659 [Serendipita sp. 400]|nr:hypothetical protein FRC18_011659 [Serendipita sp. 400]